MKIVNKFSDTEIELLQSEIFRLISKEAKLTKRSRVDLRKLLVSSSIYVAFDNEKKIVGFITKERLIDNYFEIKSWYVIPLYRGSGLAFDLLSRAIEDQTCKYIGVTFQLGVVKKAENYGFRPVSLFSLPIGVILSYLSSRKLSSIVKHVFIKKSIMLAKQ